MPVEIIFLSTLGRFFDRHRLGFFWLTLDKTYFLPTLAMIFLADIGRKTSSTDIGKKNLANVGQNIPLIDVD